MPDLTTAENKFFESGGDATAVQAENPSLAKPEGSTTIISPKEDENKQLSLENVEETPEQKQAKEAKAAEDAVKADREKKRKEAIEGLGLVPLEALQEARAEGKLTKKQLDELQDWKKQIEPILAQLPKPQTKPAEQNPYDLQTQPAEYKAWQEWTDAKQTIAELKAARERDTQVQQAQNQTAQVLGWAQQQTEAYKGTNPAYDEALKFANTARHEELKAIAPWLDDAGRNQVIQQDMAQIIVMAAQRSAQGTPTNPAELIFNYAKGKGFKNGKDPSLEAVAKIQAGQQASGGLKGGSTPKGTVSLEEVAAIDTSTPAGRKKYEEMWAKAIG